MGWVPSTLLNRLHLKDCDTLIEQSRSENKKVICITNNNHLPPASVCAELGDGKQQYINGGLTEYS